jgi:hypothetical protein
MQAHEKRQDSVLRAPVDLIADDFGRQIDHFDIGERVVRYLPPSASAFVLLY